MKFIKLEPNGQTRLMALALTLSVPELKIINYPFYYI